MGACARSTCNDPFPTWPNAYALQSRGARPVGCSVHKPVTAPWCCTRDTPSSFDGAGERYCSMLLQSNKHPVCEDSVEGTHGVPSQCEFTACGEPPPQDSVARLRDVLRAAESSLGHLRTPRHPLVALTSQVLTFTVDRAAGIMQTVGPQTLFAIGATAFGLYFTVIAPLL